VVGTGQAVAPGPTIPPASASFAAPALAIGRVTHRWVKVLSASDAQHPPSTNTQLTANLKLAKAGNDIDPKTYFRHDLFGGLNWTSEVTPRGTKESVGIPFDVVIGGRSLGTHQLQIDHAMFRVASQNNIPTWLHWGPLMQELQRHNYTGLYVIIERFSDGSYQIRIDDAPS
jgi:hypothetical protein